MTRHNPYQYVYIDQSYNNRRKAETELKLQRIRELLPTGATIAQIASALGVSIPTAYTYVARVRKEAKG